MQRIYPFGTQEFCEIRENQMVYVDKTDLIYKLVSSHHKFWFLSRPRRFGKTLLISTLETLFQGKRSYFRDLYIDESDYMWSEFPTLRLDLSIVKDGTSEGVQNTLSFIVDVECKKEGLETIDAKPALKLVKLVQDLYAKYGIPVVVLIDEYDTPLLSALTDEKQIDGIRTVMRNFYSVLKMLDKNLRFVFFTGITKFSQLSIFSELNNMKNISMDPSFAGICGISEQELHGALAQDVASLADHFGISKTEMFSRLKEMYDGYHFAKNSPDMYNPVSLFSTLTYRELKTWWYETGTSAAVIHMLRAAKIDVTQLDEPLLKASDYVFDTPTDSLVDPIAFLYQAGYLTIKEYDEASDAYTIGIPNKEVRSGLINQLLPYYVGAISADTTTTISTISGLFAQAKVEDALSLLRIFLASIPYDLAAKNEKEFQAQAYILLKSAGSKIDSEVRTSTGRIDFVLHAQGTCYIVELKYDGDPADALAQIKKKNYALGFKNQGEKLIAIGVNFDPKERTIADNWLIEQLD